ncbi:hypothetical protein AZE42_13743, partial [Rhizopogon vesiculosus]
MLINEPLTTGIHVKQELLEEKMGIPAAFIKTKAPRTMSSTFITTTDAKVPPTKKVKLEQRTDVSESDSAMPATTQMSNAWVEVIRARSAYRNPDLPPACQDTHWPKIFLPTIYLWAGSQPNLWNISDDALLNSISEVFKAVYPDVEYIPTVQGSVFGVTNQRLSEWRSNFGSTAIAIIIDFLAHNEDANAEDLA